MIDGSDVDGCQTRLHMEYGAETTYCEGLHMAHVSRGKTDSLYNPVAD